ncbi:MAG: hypothetical protein WC052_05230 [Patescibacteria group bacterium]
MQNLFEGVDEELKKKGIVPTSKPTSTNVKSSVKTDLYGGVAEELKSKGIVPTSTVIAPVKQPGAAASISITPAQIKKNASSLPAQALAKMDPVGNMATSGTTTPSLAIPKTSGPKFSDVLNAAFNVAGDFGKAKNLFEQPETIQQAAKSDEFNTQKEVTKGALRGTFKGILGGFGDIIKWVGDVATDNAKRTSLEEQLAQDNPGKFGYLAGASKSRRETSLKISEEVQALGKNVKEFFADDIGNSAFLTPHPSLTTPGYNNLDKKIVVGIAESIPSLAGAAMITATTKNPWAGASALGLLGGAQQYDEAIQSGASVQKASAIGGLSTVGNILLEKIPLDNLVSGKYVGAGWKKVASTAVLEGTQEEVQNAWMNIIAKVGYDKTRSMTEGLGLNFLIGTATGGLVDMAHNTFYAPTSHVADIKKEAIDAGVMPRELELVETQVAAAIVDNGQQIDQALREYAQNPTPFRAGEIQTRKFDLPATGETLPVIKGEFVVNANGDILEVQQQNYVGETVMPTISAINLITAQPEKVASYQARLATPQEVEAYQNLITETEARDIPEGRIRELSQQSELQNIADQLSKSRTDYLSDFMDVGEGTAEYYAKREAQQGRRTDVEARIGFDVQQLARAIKQTPEFRKEKTAPDWVREARVMQRGESVILATGENAESLQGAGYTTVTSVDELTQIGGFENPDHLIDTVLELAGERRLPKEKQYMHEQLMDTDPNYRAIVEKIEEIKKEIANEYGKQITETLAGSEQADTKTEGVPGVQAAPESDERKQTVALTTAFDDARYEQSESYASIIDSRDDRIGKQIETATPEQLQKFDVYLNDQENKLEQYAEESTVAPAPDQSTARSNTAEVEGYKGSSELSSTILERLKGRTTVSKQFIKDLSNSSDIRKPERDIVLSVLENFPEKKVSVQEFADAMQKELLPLERTTVPDDVMNGEDVRRYENVTLPKDIRGDVVEYAEHLYGSPVKTSAGNVHFSDFGMDNYFAHTRTEDMADGETRRVIEMQSDLMQKGRLDKEAFGNRPLDNRNNTNEEIDRGKEIAQLIPYEDTWQERVVKAEVKQAAEDDISTLQFPTGETAMKIEGLGQAESFEYTPEAQPNFSTQIPKVAEPSDLVVGRWLRGQGGNWIITEVLGDGKFKAIPKTLIESYLEKGESILHYLDLSAYENRLTEKNPDHADFVQSMLDNRKSFLARSSETFDISGKVDTNNPIYKFYESEVGKYLKKRYSAERVTDDQGVSWYQIDVPADAADTPIMVFGDALGNAIDTKPKRPNSDPEVAPVIVDVLPAYQGGTSDTADIGIFADGTEIKAGSMNTIKPVEFPEMVQLAKDLFGTPAIRGQRNPNRGGVFKPGVGIELNPSVFDNTDQATKILAHEIGHLIDWLPDETMKRGNLLGRLGSLHSFLKGTFGGNEFEGASLITSSNSDIRAELWEWSKFWRPFDETLSSKSFTQYRKSGVELYADALSGLLVSPGLIEEKAPKFYDAFFKALDEKPEVRSTYFELQAFLRGEPSAIIKARRGTVRGMFASADIKARQIEEMRRAESKQHKYTTYEQWKSEHVNINMPFMDKVADLKSKGVDVPAEDNPTYYLNERNYVGGKIKNTIQEKFQPILSRIQELGMSSEDLGEILFYDRILHGDRGQVANPGGFQPEFVQDMYGDLGEIDPQTDEAKEQLGSMREELGEDRFRALEQAAAEWRYSLKQVFIKGKDLYSEELMNLVNTNDFYVPFRVTKYKDGRTSYTVKTKKGTLSDIDNPVNTTLDKVAAIVRATEYNNARLKAIEFLKEYAPSDVQDAQFFFNGKFNEYKDPQSGSGLELITYHNNGKVEGIYVDTYIARSLKNARIEEIGAITKILRWTNRSWFRPVFITFNLGFQSFNIVRDFWRYWKNVPNATLIGTLKAYAKAVPAAYARGFNKDSAIIREMEGQGALSVTFNQLVEGNDIPEKEYEQILLRLGINEGEVTGGKLKKEWAATLGFIENLGNAIETLPKVAGYVELKGTMSQKELNDFVRTKIGSPDFLAGGFLTPVTNNWLIFSNAILQGITADYQVATDPTTRAGYWWKTASVNILPHVLMYAAAQGLFGDDLEELFGKMVEGDKTNYITIPIGLDENGKAVYFRVPQDESGRFIGAMVWKVLSAAKNNQPAMRDIMDVASLFGGQLPGINPAVSLVGNLGTMMLGRSPYDEFRGRDVLTEDQLKAGGKYAWEPYLKWQWNEIGGSVVLKFFYGEDTTYKKTPLERTLSLPVVSNVIGRFIRVTDYGEKESIMQLQKQFQSDEAVQRIEKRETLNKLLDDVREGKSPTAAKVEYVKAVLQGEPRDKNFKRKQLYAEKKFDLTLQRGEISPQFDSLIYAQTNDEKLGLLTEYRQRMSSQEFNQLLKDARKYNLVSKDLYSKANR